MIDHELLLSLFLLHEVKDDGSNNVKNNCENRPDNFGACTHFLFRPYFIDDPNSTNNSDDVKNVINHKVRF